MPPTDAHRPQVVIVGAGAAGLSAGVALMHLGIEPTILDKAIDGAATVVFAETPRKVAVTVAVPGLSARASPGFSGPMDTPTILGSDEDHTTLFPACASLIVSA